jgi:hypothetical protein
MDEEDLGTLHMIRDEPTERDVRLACVHASIQAYGGQVDGPQSIVEGAKTIYAWVSGEGAQ